MVRGVGSPPVTEGSQRDQPKAGSDPLIGTPVGEIRAMATIMLNDEESYVQPSRRQREQQRPAIAPTRVDSSSHEEPQRHERRQRVTQLPQRANQRRSRESAT